MKVIGIWVLSENGLGAIHTLSGVVIGASNRSGERWYKPPNPERPWEIYATHMARRDEEWWTLGWVQTEDEARQTIWEIASATDPMQ